MIFFKVIFALLFTISLYGFGQNNIAEGSSKQGKNKVSYTQMIDLMEQTNNAEQIFSLGIIYMNGIDEKDDFGQTVPKDLSKAIYYFDKSINNGYTKGYAMVGALFLYNKNLLNIKGSLNLAEKYLNKALTIGDKSAYVYLADLYTRKNNFQAAMDLLMAGANDNDATSQYMVAKFFKYGLVDPINKKQLIFKNEKKALFFLNKACSNIHKTERLKDICFNSEEVITETKPQELNK